MTDIKAWSKKIIHGTGGFLTFERCEVAAYDDRDTAIVEWTLRCLANPDSDVAEKVLRAIERHRLLKQKERK